MASHVTLCLRRSRLGWRETSPHRATLNPVYNQYEAEAITSSAALQLKAALHPIFIASFVLHDFLREQRWRGASALLVTSASSKIALGLAHLCSGSLPLVGLTAASRAPALGLRGIYATVAGYDELALLPGGERWLVVDFSGDDRLLGSLVDRLGSQCAGCLRAGFTHAVTAASGLVRPDASAAEFFFAQAQIVRRVRDWGAEEFDRRMRGALQEFLDAMRDEFSVRHLDGAQALLSGYLELHRGTVAGSEILVARPQASGDALVDPA